MGSPPRPGTAPTHRELEALQAYVEEGSVKAAAARLGISERTVKGHLANVRSRTGSLSTTQAAVRVLEPLATG